MRIQVIMWDKVVGYVLQQSNEAPSFQYHPEWLGTGLQISPIHMPLSLQPFSFKDLVGTKTFSGLPGLIADALPEKFGNQILAAHLALQGRSFEDLSALERLTYLGSRGMGALEFIPDHGHSPQSRGTTQIDIEVLAAVAEQVLDAKAKLKTELTDANLEDLVQIGTSAGGAKAKAIIGWNPLTNDVVAGQGSLPEGFEHWLLKFDAVENEEHATSQNIGRIEYAYSLMARDAKGCGIDMMDCRLFEAGGNAHFMTKRFDRDCNQKFHVQSFAAIAHADRDPVGLHGYEELFLTMKKLELPLSDLTEMYRRMVFNIAARNQDDHTKNHAFLMDGAGDWFLSPAYDLCFSYKKGNPFIEQHQMRCNGKRDNFTREDLLAAARVAGIKKPGEIIDEVLQGVSKWKSYADQAGLPEMQADWIMKRFRLNSLRESGTGAKPQGVSSSTLKM
jgi:serine/threonine-protein kinase HipA